MAERKKVSGRVVRKRKNKDQSNKDNGQSAPPTPATERDNTDVAEHDRTPDVPASPAPKRTPPEMFSLNDDPTAESKASFDEWMVHHHYYIENRPDDYEFWIIRRYPKTDPEGNPIAGVAARLSRSFSEAWVQKRFPEGGRFDVELRGPSDDNRYAGLKVPKAAYRNLQVPMSVDEDHNYGRKPVGPMMSLVDDDEEDEIEESEVEEERPSSFMEKIAERYVKSVETDQAELRRLRMQQMKPPPPPPMFDKKQEEDKTSDKILMRLLDSIQTKTPDNAEVANLHRMINKLSEAHSTEKIEQLSAHKDELDKRLREQREVYEARIKEAHASANDIIDRMKSQHEASMRMAKDDFDQRLAQANQRANDFKEDLKRVRDDAKDAARDYREEIKTLQSAVSLVREELSSAKSELTALKVTKDSEMRSAIAEERMKSLQERGTKKNDDEDPFDGMIKRIKQAKELAGSLGEQLGMSSSGDTKADKPKSRLDDLVDIAVKVGGSPEVRKLAGTVTKSLAEGFGSVMKAREETKKSSTPSTAAIIEAHKREQERRRLLEEKSHAGAASEPHETEDATPPPPPDEPKDAIDSVAEAIPTVEKMQEMANPLLDTIEDHCALGTPVDEASKEMVASLQELFDRPKEDVIEALKGTTAEETLDQLEFPRTRLSPEATEYMNTLVQHAIKS